MNRMVSSIETQIIAARDTSDQLMRALFGYGICQKAFQEEYLEEGALYGWDCIEEKDE